MKLDDSYNGELVLTRKERCFDAGMHIDRADQRVRVNRELMDGIVRAGNPNAEFDGHILRLNGVNRSVIYRMDGYDARRGQFLMSWPD